MTTDEARKRVEKLLCKWGETGAAVITDRDVMDDILALAAEEFERGQREMQAACAKVCRDTADVRRGKGWPEAAYTLLYEAAEAIEQLPSSPPSAPADSVSMPREPSDYMLIRFMNEVHSNVPEEQRPVGRSAFSDDQWARLHAAYKALLLAASDGGRGG